MHPYYAEKVSRQAEGFSPAQLGDTVARIAELDGALKGQGKLPPDLEIQRALVGQFETGAVLELAVKYQRIAATKGIPRQNH